MTPKARQQTAGIFIHIPVCRVAGERENVTEHFRAKTAKKEGWTEQKLAQMEAVVRSLRSQIDAASSSQTSNDLLPREFSAQATGAVNTPPNRPSDEPSDSSAALEYEFGRLAIGQGRSRYVASHSWASIKDQLDDLDSLLHKEQTEDHGSFTSLLFASTSTDLVELHPRADMIPIYWQEYKNNFDRVVKVLHVGITEPLILAAVASVENLDASTEALLFAIYFCAVVSTPAERCIETFGYGKDELFSRYTFAAQQAFTKARLLESDEFIVLQAFTIYLTALRFRSSLKPLWTLTALAVRLAQNAGLHRDGSAFNLPPFQSEMRRRLWWNIRVIDSRASEDSGYDSAIRLENCTTKKPLNVNDADLTPGMDMQPPERTGCTDMVFSVIRFEAAEASERMQVVPMGSYGPCGKLHIANALERKAKCIADYQKRLQQVVFAEASPDNPFYWYTAIVSRVILSKLWLIAYHPYLRLDVCGGISAETREALFSKAICIVESQLLLYNGAPTQSWSWLCVTHVQWYAITYILVELCHRTHGERVEAAWKAVKAVLRFGTNTTNHSNPQREEFGTNTQLGVLDEGEYQPLNKLLATARFARMNAVPRHPHTGEATDTSAGLGSAYPVFDGHESFAVNQSLHMDPRTEVSSFCEPLHSYIFNDPLEAHLSWGSLSSHGAQP
ncbi:hypothetical protein NLG97_g1463 [Lecanicillium saksenae]|uniref:Uncharacterized protein n=1 Tax=Lecanicillium saksenae TaxID=468837 RepID=A0ACC1R7T4_9HYPO|nr:hypothetical protein NLG97_g1463 [Lecanicillium saksenae]